MIPESKDSVTLGQSIEKKTPAVQMDAADNAGCLSRPHHLPYHDLNYNYDAHPAPRSHEMNPPEHFMPQQHHYPQQLDHRNEELPLDLRIHRFLKDHVRDQSSTPLKKRTIGIKRPRMEDSEQRGTDTNMEEKSAGIVSSQSGMVYGGHPTAVGQVNKRDSNSPSYGRPSGLPLKHQRHSPYSLPAPDHPSGGHRSPGVSDTNYHPYQSLPQPPSPPHPTSPSPLHTSAYCRDQPHDPRGRSPYGVGFNTASYHLYRSEPTIPVSPCQAHSISPSNGMLCAPHPASTPGLSSSPQLHTLSPHPSSQISPRLNSTLFRPYEDVQAEKSPQSSEYDNVNVAQEYTHHNANSDVPASSLSLLCQAAFTLTPPVQDNVRQEERVQKSCHPMDQQQPQFVELMPRQNFQSEENSGDSSSSLPAHSEYRNANGSFYAHPYESGIKYVSPCPSVGSWQDHSHLSLAYQSRKFAPESVTPPSDDDNSSSPLSASKQAKKEEDYKSSSSRMIKPARALISISHEVIARSEACAKQEAMQLFKHNNFQTNSCIKETGVNSIQTPDENVRSCHDIKAPDPDLKMSPLDYIISKVLVDRIDIPFKPCNHELKKIYRGERKGPLRLVDLIELQVEESLKA